MEMRIQNLPAFVVVGARHQGGMQSGEISQFWEQWGEAVTEQAASEPGVSYGLTVGFEGATMTIDYLAAVPVAADAAVPEGMVRWEVPAQTYAVFDCTLATLSETIMKVYHDWLPRSGYQRGYGPELERYDPTFDTPEQPLTFWLPILGGVTGSGG
jgi:AraC family transcriptional regulator